MTNLSSIEFIQLALCHYTRNVVMLRNDEKINYILSSLLNKIKM